MKIKKKMEVGADEFFEFLQYVLLKELKHSVDKKITKSQLKPGFEFTRKVEVNGKKHVTKCVLEVFERPYEYCLKIDTGRSVQRIIHHIEEIDETHIIDHYEENISDGDWKVKLQSFFEKDSMKSKMRDTLNKFEVQVKSRRR